MARANGNAVSPPFVLSVTPCESVEHGTSSTQEATPFSLSLSAQTATMRRCLASEEFAPWLPLHRRNLLSRRDRSPSFTARLGE